MVKFSKNSNLIAGKNGTGKTNILESIYLLATGSSFRAKKGEEMIFYGQELGRVSGDIVKTEEVGLSDIENIETMEIVLTRGEVQGEKVSKRRYLVNGVKKRKMDFLGRLRVVLFRPEDIELVLGNPSGRRNYLDEVLEQSNREYRRSNLSYQKGLRQRNKLLVKIREGEAERHQLLFWDKLLLKNGEVVSQKRASFLKFVNDNLEKKGLDLSLEYDKSAISESRLNQYKYQEVAAGMTLVGPHRDDFLFVKQRKGKEKKNLSIYGSRGEQRMAVFEVKLAEFEYMDEAIEGEKDRPVLLLDDVFSELDKEHRREVFKLLEKQQTIMTTNDLRMIPKGYLKKLKMIKL